MISHIELAERLGYRRTSSIKRAIERAEKLGHIHGIERVSNGHLVGRPGDNFLLTEEQAKVVSAFVKGPQKSHGWIYFVGWSGSFAVKIGFTVDSRRRFGGLQTGLPFDLVVERELRGSKALETKLHEHCERDWVRGEWFKREGKCAELLALSDAEIYRRFGGDQ